MADVSAGCFVGIDLAWAARNRTGMAATDGDGRLIASGTVTTDDEIQGWIEALPLRVAIAAVDAPVVVPNATGQRAGEKEVARAYARYGAAPHSSNRSKPHFDPPRALTLADRLGWDVDPEHVGTVEDPACIEVYPHPAIVGIFRLGRRIAYKRGPGRADGIAELMGHLETVPELGLGDHDRWAELRAVASAPGPGDLGRVEDEIDAIVCAHLAWLWRHRPASLQVYGSLAEGYIVAPPPPSHPADRSGRRPTVVVERVVMGDPAAFASDAEPEWKAQIADALAGVAHIVGERFEVELDFVLSEQPPWHPRREIDNLIKPVLDSLGPLIGYRTGARSDEADDSKVARLVAQKRKVAGAGEEPHCRLAVRPLT